MIQLKVNGASRKFDGDPDVPLVVPEVNGVTLNNHAGVIANPNCATAVPLGVCRNSMSRVRLPSKMTWLKAGMVQGWFFSSRYSGAKARRTLDSALCSSCDTACREIPIILATSVFDRIATRLINAPRNRPLANPNAR